MELILLSKYIYFIVENQTLALESWNIDMIFPPWVAKRSRAIPPISQDSPLSIQKSQGKTLLAATTH